ncbi:MAG: sulfatase-like hydrolase/transferase [Gammaproteobacteria bacterium]|nr:sulfatase-like hydrolase/transferase [Gammaproteobacteria bacterium]
MKVIKLISVTVLGAGLILSSQAYAAKKPNILVLWGDDVGYSNSSIYNQGMMGYKTPNIDSIAQDGALFTDMYAQQSCTAGRASFILGQHPFRTGLLTIGMPGADHGIADWMPTIADLLKDQGYTSGQFGKNHLGDQDHHLPTNHGFDEFFGNLYHLNAEEEPETYHYPKDPEFKKKYGPRGVIHSSSDGKIEDTGPLTRKRMETVDYEFGAAAKDFMQRAVKADKPFFVWMNYSRMHVWTRLQEKYQGITGVSLYADGMKELDDMVGDMLAHVKKLGVEDNTIVIFSTDNGAETFTWPDGGLTPFHGEKGTTWEGGMRVPQMVKWPDTIKAGTIYNDIMSQEDWMPTLLAAAGVSDVKEKLASKSGLKANGKDFRVHLDGFNFLPYFQGKEERGPRHDIYYFSALGDLNAIRMDDFKVAFAIEEGAINEAIRVTPNWPIITNLRADPFEKGYNESALYLRWYADMMWLFVPTQEKVAQFISSLEGYPMQEGMELNPGGINYKSLKAMKALHELKGIKSELKFPALN